MFTFKHQCMQIWHKIFCLEQSNRSESFHICYWMLLDWICIEVIIECLFLSSVHTTMKSALSSITSERERLKQYLDHETCPPTSPQVVGLKNALATVGENTRTWTLWHRKLPNVCQGLHFASDFHSSQVPFSPTPCSRRDTSASRSQE